MCLFHHSWFKARYFPLIATVYLFPSNLFGSYSLAISIVDLFWWSADTEPCLTKKTTNCNTPIGETWGVIKIIFHFISWKNKSSESGIQTSIASPLSPVFKRLPCAHASKHVHVHVCTHVHTHTCAHTGTHTKHTNRLSFACDVYTYRKYNKASYIKYTFWKVIYGRG